MGNLARRLDQNYEQLVEVKTTKVVRKGRLTFGEKLLGLIFCILIFGAGIKLVTYQTSIYEINKDIQHINGQIEEQSKINLELANQISEQNTYERIWAKAVELGLMLNENNVKVVQE